jgi:hypothetical protein
MGRVRAMTLTTLLVVALTFGLEGLLWLLRA